MHKNDLQKIVVCFTVHGFETTRNPCHKFSLLYYSKQKKEIQEKSKESHFLQQKFVVFFLPFLYHGNHLMATQICLANTSPIQIQAESKHSKLVVTIILILDQQEDWSGSGLMAHSCTPYESQTLTHLCSGFVYLYQAWCKKKHCGQAEDVLLWQKRPVGRPNHRSDQKQIIDMTIIHPLRLWDTEHISI